MSDKRNVHNGKHITGPDYPSWRDTPPPSQVFLRWFGWVCVSTGMLLAVVMAAVALSK